MKKFIALACAAVLTVASAVTAFAQPSVSVSGVVTAVTTATDKDGKAVNATFGEVPAEYASAVAEVKTEAKLKKLLPAVEKASEYVNAIETDKRLEGIATVLYIVQKNNAKYDLQSITEQFKNWSEDKEKRFSEEEIVEYINYLEDTNIILKNICGLYEEYKEI